MRKKVIPIIVTLTIAFSLLSSVNAKETSEGYNQIDEYLQSSVKSANIPGMASIIVNKDNVLFSNTYGNCPSIDTPFIIGSLSKSFTAISIMQLVEQGRISLNDKISTYLHDVAVGDKITVKQLLNQKSGLGAYQSLSNLKMTDSYGTYQYANINYGLLGKVIETVSGMSYEEYLTEHIFNPLKMTRSAASLEGSRKNGLIDGYRNFFGIPVAGAPAYPDECSWSQVSAGYISSSISDMGKYLQMYLSGGKNVVSAKSIDTVFYDNVPVKSGSPSYYGMGWSLSGEYSQPVLGHSGLVENYMSYMFILPKSGIGGVILVNTNDYLVANSIMDDNIRKSLILMLTGNAPININEHKYLTSHLLLDSSYLVIFLVALSPLLLLKRYKRKLSVVKRNRTIIIIGILHLIFPTALILSPYIFATPLWVVRDYVPDLFLVLVISASFLYISGVIKVILFRKAKHMCINNTK